MLQDQSSTQVNLLKSRSKLLVSFSCFAHSLNYLELFLFYSLGEMLGSGQFGEVYKGVWVRSLDNMEVAIKTLKEGSSDDDKVKFLQEAAIMGQFKHPNVVTMYGVVTDGEPVS